MRQHILQTAIATAMILAACTPKDKEFTFVQLSDPQLCFPRETGIEGTTAFQLDSIHLEKAIIQINELKPAFVIVTGDLVHDRANEHDVNSYIELMAKIDPAIPVYQIPGNHDIRNGKVENHTEEFIDKFGNDRFAFEYEGHKFIGINSSIIRYESGQLEPEQFEWLSSELESSKAKNEPAFVFSHIPVYVDSMEDDESSHSFQPGMRRKYWDLFKANGVIAVIAGHTHFNRQNSFEGISNIITGPSSYSFEGQGKEGIRLWTVSNGQFKSEFIYLPCDQVDLTKGFEADKLQAPWHGRNDNTRFSCNANHDRFYFSFDVTDSTMISPTPSDSERVVEDEDRVEVFFSPTMSLRNKYYCAEIDAAGRIMDYKAEYFRKFDFKWNFKTMEAKGEITPEGYKVSGSVSLQELESLGMDLENGFRMGAYRGDRIADGLIEWYSLVPVDVPEPDFHMPGLMLECKATAKSIK